MAQRQTPRTADQVLSLRYVSYLAPLKTARQWVRSGDRSLTRQAVDLLSRLRRDYPHALEIGHELVLALLECGHDTDARRVLDELDEICLNPNEELLCRWGRLYKDHGDRYVRVSKGDADDKPEDRVSAQRYYRLALEKYEEAYRIRSGHYPGVNVASLLLAVHALSPADSRSPADLEACEKQARELLARRTSWPDELPDDNIWHPATAAECHLLLQEWEQAATLYAHAAREKNCQPFHVESMRRQAARNLLCFDRIRITDVGPLGELDRLFSKRTVAARSRTTASQTNQPLRESQRINRPGKRPRPKRRKTKNVRAEADRHEKRRTARRNR